LRIKRLQNAFDLSIAETIGGPSMEKVLIGLDQDAVTPEYDLYKDDIQGTSKHIPDGEDSVTPEDYDSYVGAVWKGGEKGKGCSRESTWKIQQESNSGYQAL